jgi:putative ABC transport system permease protein
VTAGRSRYSGLGIALRSRSAVRGPSLLVGCLVFVLAALVVAGPSLFARLTAAELGHTLAQVPPKDRYLTARSSSPMVAYSSARADAGASRSLSAAQDALYGTFLDQLDTLAGSFPQPLRSAVGAVRWSILAPVEGIDPSGLTTDPAAKNVAVQGVVDLDAADVAELVAGSWPATDKAPQSGTSDIVVSEQTAAHLGLSVGREIPPYRVSGIFRPKDPGADYWALHPGMVQPNIFDDGNKPVRITATVFVDPLGVPPRTSQTDSLTQVWFPLDLSGMDGAQAGLVLSQLRGVTAKSHALPTGPVSEQPEGSIQSLTLTAGVIPALGTALDRITSARSVLVVAAIGPLGAVIAVVVLALGALAERRRPTVAALATRGGSGRQIRALLAADGLTGGLIPALVAVSSGLARLPVRPLPDRSHLGRADRVGSGRIPGGDTDLADRDAGTAGQRSPGQASLPMGGRARGARGRRGLGLPCCFSAGLQTGSSGVGLDVLVAAAPLLLAAAACVVVLPQLSGAPLRLLASRLRKGRSAVGFLGALRALRDPAVGVAPVLAVVVGVRRRGVLRGHGQHPVRRHPGPRPPRPWAPTCGSTP